jgi:hypothetical protein
VTHGAKERVQGKGPSREQKSRGPGPEVDRKRGAGLLSVPALSRVAPGEQPKPGKGPGADKPAARPLTIAAGRSYRLRNGARVKVLNQREIATRIDGKPARYRFWIGIFDGTRQKCTWQPDGRYSPVADGPLDIVARV